MSERAALIAELRDVHARRWALGMPVFSKAADMLEADVSLINEDNKAQQVLTIEQLDALADECTGRSGCLNYEQFARTIEAHHKIGAPS